MLAMFEETLKYHRKMNYCYCCYVALAVVLHALITIKSALTTENRKYFYCNVKNVKIIIIIDKSYINIEKGSARFLKFNSGFGR